MKDSRHSIYEQLFDLLKPVGVPTYSVIPNNIDKPFIYLGDIQFTEGQDKSGFLVTGFASIELYSGSNEWTGSLVPLLDNLYMIKYYLQPSKGFTLDLSPFFSMAYWTLSSDTGLLQYSTTERLHVATLQYRFALKEATGFATRVATDNGIMEALACIPIPYR